MPTYEYKEYYKDLEAADPTPTGGSRSSLKRGKSPKRSSKKSVASGGIGSYQTANMTHNVNVNHNPPYPPPFVDSTQATNTMNHHAMNPSDDDLTKDSPDVRPTNYSRYSPKKNQSSKNPSKKTKGLVNFLFGRRHKSGKQHDHQRHRFVDEEKALLLKHQQQQQHDIRSAGTFDTATEEYDHYSNNPRSPGRLSHKWGKLKDQMNPEQWNRVANSDAASSVLEGMSTSAAAEIKRKAQNDIRSMSEYALWHCVVAIIVYVGVSVGVFSFWLEDWSVVDSIYFSVVTFTTIGYGDLFPDSRVARMFTCVWALSGVACLGIALGILGSNLIEVAEEEQKQAQQEQKLQVFDMFSGPVPSSKKNKNKRASAANHAQLQLLQQHKIQRQLQTHNTTTNATASDDATDSQCWSELGNHGVEDYYKDILSFEADDDDDDGESDAGACASCCNNNNNKCCACLSSPKSLRFALLFTFLVVLLFFMMRVEGWTTPATMYYGLITGTFTKKDSEGKVHGCGATSIMDDEEMSNTTLSLSLFLFDLRL